MIYSANKYLSVEDLVLGDARHSTIGRDHDFKDLKDELRESCFITEDERESLSLPRSSPFSKILFWTSNFFVFKLILFLLMVSLAVKSHLHLLQVIFIIGSSCGLNL